MLQNHVIPVWSMLTVDQEQGRSQGQEPQKTHSCKAYINVLPPLGNKRSFSVSIQPHCHVCLSCCQLGSSLLPTDYSLNTLLSLGWIHPPIQAVFNSERKKGTLLFRAHPPPCGHTDADADTPGIHISENGAFDLSVLGLVESG